MADGFLGRWSQRKQALREGRAVPELPDSLTPKAAAAVAGLPVATAPHSATAAASVIARSPRTNPAQTPDAASLQPSAGIDAAQKPAPAPTLEDVKALNADSNFAPFVSRNVAPDVRNAAMKKLFTDPHYNVMDGLDIYIDDYSLADPLPAAVLRQMTSAKFLNLFDETPTATPDQTPARPCALPPDSASTPATLTENTPHDHTDLRLQPDHAARPEGSERQPE